MICRDKAEFCRIFFKAMDECEDSNWVYDHKKFDELDESDWEAEIDDCLRDFLCWHLPGQNVQVDYENVGEYCEGALHGFSTTPGGHVFYAFDCGGDWECPLNAIIYAEDGKIKMYVPDKGNFYDREFNCAYGSEPDGHEVDVPGLDNVYDSAEEMADIAGFFGEATGPGEHGLVARRDVFKVVVESLAFKPTVDGKVGIVPVTMISEIASDEEQARRVAFSAMHQIYTKNASGAAVDEKEFVADPGKHVPIIERGGVPKYGEDYGYVHEKSGWCERWEGFDTCGNYPCMMVDITIARREVWVSADSPEFALKEFISAEEEKRRESEEEERHRLNQECIDSFNRKFKEEQGTCGSDDEYNTIMGILGDDDDKGDK